MAMMVTMEFSMELTMLSLAPASTSAAAGAEHGTNHDQKRCGNPAKAAEDEQQHQGEHTE
jgi:hypothetical protein